MKIAIMTDSNSGITQKEAKELGIYCIPMPFTIDGKEFEEDINLTQEHFYEKLMGGAEVFTSQPTIGIIAKKWDEILKTHDAIIHIPMSSGLSGSCQTAMMMADEDQYKGKVFVVDSQRISATQKADVLDAIAMADKEYSAKEIYDYLMNNKLNATIYITVDTLEYLKKGGRLSPAAATLAGLLKIKPILTIQGEKLDKYGTSRTMKKARKMMIDQVKQDISDRGWGDDYEVACVYSYDKEAALDYLEQVKEAFPDKEVIFDRLSLSVACHIGPGSLAVAAYKKGSY